jgi:hypothetical protein
VVVPPFAASSRLARRLSQVSSEHSIAGELFLSAANLNRQARACMQVIPAIELKNGRCVRLNEARGRRQCYDRVPVEVGLRLSDPVRVEFLSRPLQGKARPVASDSRRTQERESPSSHLRRWDAGFLVGRVGWAFQEIRHMYLLASSKIIK